MDPHINNGADGGAAAQDPNGSTNSQVDISLVYDAMMVSREGDYTLSIPRLSVLEAWMDYITAASH
jgi:hypothetical protein